MSKKPKQEIKVKILESLLSLAQLPDLSAIKKSLQPALEIRERMQGMFKDLQPGINMAPEVHKRYQEFNAPLTRDVG